MRKTGGGALLVAGIFLVILGAIILSSIIEWLLDILGLLVIIAGVIVGVYGLIKMFSGGQSSSGEF